MKALGLKAAGLLSLLLCFILLLAACGADEEVAEPEPDVDADVEEDEDEVEEAPEPEDVDEPDDGYPERDTEWIVPFAAGGAADVSMRLFAKYAEPIAGVTMSIINVEGAGGVTGWTQFINGPQEGYNLSLATPPFNVIPAVMQPDATPYELEQFQYMCAFAVSPNAIYVHMDDDRFETLEDVLEFSRENPGQLTASMTGAAGTDIIHMHLLEREAGVEFTAVPYDSGADATTALAGGDVDLSFSDTSWLESHPDQVRALAVSAEERHPSWPDLPTYEEQGYDVFGARIRAPAAPPDAPQHVIDFWEDLCRQVADDPDFVDEMAEVGQPVGFMDAEEARAFVEDMEADIRTIVEEFGLEQ